MTKKRNIVRIHIDIISKRKGGDTPKSSITQSCWTFIVSCWYKVFKYFASPRLPKCTCISERMLFSLFQIVWPWPLRLFGYNVQYSLTLKESRPGGCNYMMDSGNGPWSHPFMKCTNNLRSFHHGICLILTISFIHHRHSCGDESR